MTRCARIVVTLAWLLGAAAPAYAQLELWTNNASSTLASGISSGATSLTVATGDGAKFPTIAGGSGNYFWLTLEDANPATTREIVKVTARSADVLTIVRAQQSTSALAFLTGAIAAHRATRSTYEGLQAVTQTNLNMSGETAARFTITDAAVGTTSKIVGTIQRPTVADTDDEGWHYDFNIVAVAAGSFDVVVWLMDADDDFRPPTETVILNYIVR
jgi:hypothetical protein